MNTFKKKSLYAALAGASALGVTGAAQAVNVNQDGLGEVLIYPYYTIQDKVPGVPFTSMLSVVNSTASVKAVKVRFLEGRASMEVLDFNLFLSPKDVWTAAVLPTAAGGAGVATYDVSCTVPKVPNDPLNPEPFRSALYEGDLAGDGIERTKEGYVEIIEMGVPTNAAVVKSITHVNGVAPCTGLTTLDNAGAAMAPASGGLFGGMTLINVLAGEDYTSDAVALADFRDDGFYDQPGTINPDLTAVSPAIAIVTNGANLQGGGVLTSGGFTQSVDAVSALFMHDHIYNEFVLDSGTKSGTDWVITMPTKRYYYTDVGGSTVSREVQYLFQRDFGATGACDDVKIDLYDREERNVTSVDFSPSAAGPKICWEANVITFNNTNVFGSKNSRNISTTFQNGWADLTFPVVGSAHKLVSNATLRTSLLGVTTLGTATYQGLPVIGFAAISFQNGTLKDPQGNLVQSIYGGNFVHKSSRSVVFTPLPQQ